MFRWWFVGLVVAAMFTQYTSIAFANGCEAGDTSRGHNAIAFCRSGATGSTTIRGAAARAWPSDLDTR